MTLQNKIRHYSSGQIYFFITITKEPSSKQIVKRLVDPTHPHRSHLSEVLLIEFSSDAISAKIQKEFTLLGEHFQLKTMVRNCAGHFTCALSENDAEKLEYLDDLYETSYY